MDCPVCKVPLIVVERDRIELDYCLTCHGLWFDSGELELLAEKLCLPATLPDITAQGSVNVAEQQRPCPRCRTKMDKIRIGQESPVLLDRCVHGDGLWFDGGELGQLLEQYIETSAKDGAQGVINFLGETFGKKDD